MFIHTVALLATWYPDGGQRLSDFCAFVFFFLELGDHGWGYSVFILSTLALRDRYLLEDGVKGFTVHKFN